MHKAGKVIFRITNGSALFVLESFTLNANVLYGLITVQDETSNNGVGSCSLCSLKGLHSDCSSHCMICEL